MDQLPHVKGTKYKHEWKIFVYYTLPLTKLGSKIYRKGLGWAAGKTFNPAGRISEIMLRALWLNTEAVMM